MIDLFVIGGGINGAGHRARCRRPRPVGRSCARRTTWREGTLVALGQAGPWRPALSRILRVPPGARGADRARGAAERRPATSSGRCASCCRTAPRTAPPGWCGSASSSTTISAAARSCRARARSTCAAIRRARRSSTSTPRGFEYSDCWVDDARLVVLNARRRRGEGRRGPDPHRLHQRPPRERRLDRRRSATSAPGEVRTVRAQGARQCRRPLGERRHRPRRRARTPAATSGWSRAATSSCRSSGRAGRPIWCRTTTSA